MGQGIIQFYRKPRNREVTALAQYAQPESGRVRTGTKVGLAPGPTHLLLAMSHVPSGMTSGRAMFLHRDPCHEQQWLLLKIRNDSGKWTLVFPIPYTCWVLRSLSSKVNYPSTECITHLVQPYRGMEIRKLLLRTHGPQANLSHFSLSLSLSEVG